MDHGAAHETVEKISLVKHSQYKTFPLNTHEGDALGRVIGTEGLGGPDGKPLRASRMRKEQDVFQFTYNALRDVSRGVMQGVIGSPASLTVGEGKSPWMLLNRLLHLPWGVVNGESKR